MEGASPFRCVARRLSACACACGEVGGPAAVPAADETAPGYGMQSFVVIGHRVDSMYYYYLMYEL